MGKIASVPVGFDTVVVAAAAGVAVVLCWPFASNVSF